ncbi:MAG: ATP-binding protein [Chitinophagaceae bacterium]|nr:ATP-binding protein [Chitinophagaceae bacterium]
MGTYEKDIYFALIIAFGLIGIILFYFLWSVIRQQRRYQALANAKINAEIATLEKERKRIAGDLHDDIGPLLSAIKLQMSFLKPIDEQETVVLQRSGEYIDEVITKMREISNDLLPNILIRKGLVTAIERFIDKLPVSGMEVKFQSDLTYRPGPDIEINLYRIVQEVVHNALKHAKASQLKIELRQEKSHIVLATADNGVGLPLNFESRKEPGLGFLNLQSRTEVMGGEFHIQSRAGSGLSFLFEIPIIQADEHTR